MVISWPFYEATFLNISCKLQTSLSSHHSSQVLSHLPELSKAQQLSFRPFSETQLIKDPVCGCHWKFSLKLSPGKLYFCLLLFLHTQSLKRCNFVLHKTSINDFSKLILILPIQLSANSRIYGVLNSIICISQNHLSFY